MDAAPAPSPAAHAPAAPPPRAAQAPSPVVAPAVAPVVASGAQPRGRLVLIARDGAEGASFPLAMDQVDIGAREGDIVVIDDAFVSSRHARISRRALPSGGPGLFLKDLASCNGVYLQLRTPAASAPGASPGASPGAAASPGAPPETVFEAALEDQDLFLVGQQVLLFQVVVEGEEGLGAATEHGTLIFGTPAGPSYARLAQRTTEGVARDVFYLRKAETVLGRESGDIVFTDDPFLSRRHARVMADPARKRFLLQDLGSSNGTFLKIRREVSLRHGDQFRIGQQLFRVDTTRDP